MSRVKPVSGLAWCGTWHDGTLGWQVSEYVSAGQSPLSRTQRKILDGDPNYYPADFYRVRVTIEPVKDKNGRYIVKRNLRGGTQK